MVPTHLRHTSQGRSVLLAAVAALLALSAFGPAVSAHSGREGGSSKPTIVLVHGAWADPSGWDRVVRELREDGFRTVTPTLSLLSLDGDVATVRATLDGIRGKKILVGHSYGGFVISNAAAGRSDVLGLVYSAAFAPDAGETVVGLGQGFIPSEAFGHLVFTGEPFNSPAFIDPAFFPQFFAQDLRPRLAAKLNAAQIPANFSLFFTPSGPVAWHSLPTWYAVSGSDLLIDPAQQRWMAQRAGATTIEFGDASHIGGIIRHSDRFTKLIEQAVNATR